MKRAIVLVLLCLVTLPAFAKPKKKTFNNSPEQVFAAALRTARERHVVTYVDEKQLMFTFQTGMSVWSYGFVCNASVESEGPDRATLIINVQNKQGLSMGAGDRMADKFFKQTEEELAGDVSQKVEAHPDAKAIAVPDPKALPSEPTMTRPSSDPAAPEFGKIAVLSVPESAEVTLDANFVGNAPTEFRLSPGKHTFQVSAKGYKKWTREITIVAGSEVHLKAELEKE